MNTSFKIGDKVSFLNEKRNGTIANILSNFRLLVTTEDGFDISVSANELVPLTEKSTYVIDSRKMREKDEQEIQIPKLEHDEVWEVDLHLTDILDTGREMTDHEKLKAQLSHFNKCMQAAIAHRIKKIIFIHGVGKGTLKQEILHALKNYDRTRCYDAPLKKYGFGAMVVEIF
jgi:dsDNA-specific endonuclease/ATPase MutS2